MPFKRYVQYVLLSVSSITFATPPNFSFHHVSPEVKATIQDLLKNNKTYAELLELVNDLENGTDLEEKYDQKEINDFLASIAKLGSLIKDSQEDQLLDESIDKLYQEMEVNDYLTQSDSPSWYQDVYFPNQLNALNNNRYGNTSFEIQHCGFNLGKICKNIGKGIEKGVKTVAKFTKNRIQELAKIPKKVEKFVRKNLGGASKKSWDKTRKFIKKHKKAIIIGLAVIVIVTLAILFAPEVSALLAALVPAATDGPQENNIPIANQNEEIPNLNEKGAASYTEDNFIEDCIELVQEELLESGLNQLPIEDSFSNSVLESIKGCASRISHDLIDAVDAQLQQLNAFKYLPEKLHELFPTLPTINQSEESLFSNGTDIGIAYLHQKTDELFDTSLAERYTEEAKAYRAEQPGMLELGLPPPPGLFGGMEGTKNVLKKFTKTNYRQNLKKAQPLETYSEVHAHHVFPQQFEEFFLKRGINIHDPKNVTWWKASEHQNAARQYNLDWIKFMKDNPEATQAQILQKGKEMMAEFGITTNY